MMAPVAQLEAAFGRHGIRLTAAWCSIPSGRRCGRRGSGGCCARSASTTSPCSTAASTNGPRKAATSRPACRDYPSATFPAKPRPGFFVGKDEVLAATGDPDTVTVNALGPQFYKGLEPSRYGRPGRIPGSVNVPAATLIDPATKAFVPLADAEQKFAAQGFSRDKRVVAYCGGGISATIDLFMLHRLGYDKLTLYDASMGEWAMDDKLPIEVG